MTIQIEQMANTTLIRLIGRLDGVNMEAVETQFLHLIDQCRSHFLFNMSQLDYISSAGLRVMLLAVKKTRTLGGKIALCELNQSVDEVFQISGFSTIFPIFASQEEAERSFER